MAPLNKTQFSLSLSPLYHLFMTSFEQSKRAAKDHTTLKTKHEEISISVMLEHHRIITRTCIYVHNIICVHAYHPLFCVPLKWCSMSVTQVMYMANLYSQESQHLGHTVKCLSDVKAPFY